MERVARNRIEVVRLAYLTIPSPLGMQALPAHSTPGTRPGVRA
jgi:hypothetical protein